MIKRTWADVKTELARVAGQAGVRADGDSLRNYANLAQERLITAGEWPFCYARLKFAQYEGLIALPSEFEALIKADVDRSPVKVFDRWYEFLEYGPGQQDKQGWTASAIDRGESPVYRQPGATAQVVRVTAAVDELVGDERRTVTILGYDGSGEWVRTEVDGVWQDGETVELKGDQEENYADTETLFKVITQVIKPATNGAVSISYINEFEEETIAARYRHNEVNPTYRTYFLPSIATDTTALVHALVRRRFTPVAADSDLLLVTSLPALRLGVIGIAQQDAGKTVEAEQTFAIAAGILREEAKLYSGSPKPPLDVSPVCAFDIDDVR